MPYQPDLEHMLVAGLRVEDEGITFVLEPHELGKVTLPTGRVIGCDPLVPMSEPFTQTVMSGSYPLRAWVAVMSRDGSAWQSRIAALQLVIEDAPAVRWTMALLDGQDPATLGDDEFFGYGVDAGTGTLADTVAITALDGWDYDRIDETFIPARFPDDPIEAVLSAVTDDATGANVFVVGSGWGDGTYATYIGYDDADQVTSFVTDFRVLPA